MGMYKQMCEGKHQHKSRGAAEAHLRGLARLGDISRLNAYPCPWCRNWHVGHRKMRKTRETE